MKRLCIISSILVLAAFPASSQYWSVGAKSGMNISTIGEHLDDPRVGFYLGGYGEYLFNSNWGVKAELLYSGQGGKLKNDWNDITDRLYYLNLPVMVNYHLLDRINFETGPQVGLLTNSKSIYKTSDGITYKSTTGAQTWDLAIVFGIGCRLWKRTAVTARYDLGLKNVYMIDCSNDTSSNRVFRVGLSCEF